MPKGSKKKKSARRSESHEHPRDDDGDDARSMGSMDTSFSLASIDALGAAAGGGGGVSEGEEDDGAPRTLSDKMNDVLDMLTEKRGSTRESGLSSLCKGLSKHLMLDFLDGKLLSIIDPVHRSLRKGGSNERVLAAQALTLTYVQAGEEVEADSSTEMASLLTELVYGTATPAVRAAAATALAMCTFIRADDASQVKGVLDVLTNLIDSGKTGAALLVACLRGYALLVTRMSFSFVASAFVARVTRAAALLEHENVNVRVAAGEFIALLFEIADENESGGGDDDMDDDGDNGGNNASDELRNRVDVDELLERLRALSKDSQKHRAKKDRKAQRSSFREIVATVEEGEQPSELLRFAHGEEVAFRGWQDLVRLNAFRDALGEGTRTHFEQNPLVRDVFELGAPPIANSGGASGPERRLTALEKRKYMSPNSAAAKARTKDRLRRRDKRMA